MPIRLFKKKKFLVLSIILLILLVLFSYSQNNWLTTTSITIKSKELPSNFDGYKIVQLSDIHNKTFGKNQKRLVSKVKNEKPDIIFVTGDLIDARKYDEEPSLILMEQLVNIAPTYFVTGNHEWSSGKYESLEAKLLSAGVHVLRNESERLTIEEQKILLLGIDDPYGSESYVDVAITKDSLNPFADEIEQSSYTLLLAHRPELFSTYQEYGIDVTFSGHAHGGQVRLPFVGGLVAPGQGFFPNFTAGKYEENESTLVVSRGLGNSIIPQRIFNLPEVVSITLETE
nr:metallophosphoesterase [Ornithinibacillus halophilus]